MDSLWNFKKDGSIPSPSTMKPMKISHSSYSAWNRCQRQYKFSYVDGWQVKTLPADSPMTKGNKLHELLDIYYRAVMIQTPPDQIKNAIVQRVQQWMREAQSGKDIDLYKHLIRVLERYINEVAAEDTGWKWLASESKRSIQLESPKGNQFILTYILDLIGVNGKNVWIWDHKTHTNNPWKDDQLTMDAQMTTYLAAEKRAGMNPIGFVINAFNMHPYKSFETEPISKIHQRHEVYRSGAELDSILDQLGMAVDEILEIQQRGSYRKALNKDCAFCHFKDPCLQELRGRNADDYMDNFTKRSITLTPSARIDII